MHGCGVSKKVRKVTRRERVALAKQWASLFPVVLLLFGPPPEYSDDSDVHWTEQIDRRGHYFGVVTRWYHANYLHMYDKPETIIRGLSNGFRHAFETWYRKKLHSV